MEWKNPWDDSSDAWSTPLDQQGGFDPMRKSRYDYIESGKEKSEYQEPYGEYGESSSDPTMRVHQPAAGSAPEQEYQEGDGTVGVRQPGLGQGGSAPVSDWGHMGGYYPPADDVGDEKPPKKKKKSGALKGILIALVFLIAAAVWGVLIYFFFINNQHEFKLFSVIGETVSSIGDTFGAAGNPFESIGDTVGSFVGDIFDKSDDDSDQGGNDSGDNSSQGTGTAQPETTTPETTATTAGQDGTVEFFIDEGEDEQMSQASAAPAAETSAQPVSYTLKVGKKKEAPIDASKRIKVVSADASSVIKQDGYSNDPLLAFDDDKSTNWQEGKSDIGIGESLTGYFETTEKVKYITFRLGNWKSESYFYGNYRPTALTLMLGDVNEIVRFPSDPVEYCVEITPACSASELKVIIEEATTRDNEWQDTVISDIGLYRE